MFRKFFYLLFVLSSFVWISGSARALAQAEDSPKPVVHAVMFWMSTCGHCHYVMENVLPPLQAQYGDQLDILLVEVKSAADADILVAAAAELGLGSGGVGVPFLIIGDRALVGSDQIPAELPGLIEQHLAEGGIDFPKLAALEGVVPTPVPAPVEGEPAVESPTVGEPVAPSAREAASAAVVDGAIMAMVVLFGMAAALIAAIGGLWLARSGRIRPPNGGWMTYVVPVLAGLGLVVAAYLAYVETQAAEAVCGPVGDCNAVQSSAYARLFGVPIGVIGVVGYLAILAGWVLVRRTGSPIMKTLLVAMTAVGVVFSIYLTYLELFVIRAVCMWCITSAVIMTLLLLASAVIAASPEPDSAHPLNPAHL